MGLHDYTFYDLINRNAVSFGDGAAWFEVDDVRKLTFAEYKEKVDHLAKGLQDVGIKKGNRNGAASVIKDEHWSFEYHQKYLRKFYSLNT